MLKKILFITFLICAAMLQIISAQTPHPPPTSVQKGVINGVAISLPKPVYPESARQAKVGSTVNVEVKIDETGKVVSATAVSGNEVFRAAAEQAALQALFKPTLLSGKPVKVTGIIVYNFVAEKKENEPYWVLGVLVTFFQTEPQLLKGAFPDSDLKQMRGDLDSEDFPSDLTAEKELFVKLFNADDNNRQQFAGELDESLKKNLKGEKIWEYEVGANLGVIFVEILKYGKGITDGSYQMDEARLKASLQKVKDLSEAAPTESSAEFVEQIKRIAVFNEEPKLNSQEKLYLLFKTVETLFDSIPDE